MKFEIGMNLTSVYAPYACISIQIIIDNYSLKRQRLLTNTDRATPVLGTLHILDGHCFYPKRRVVLIDMDLFSSVLFGHVTDLQT